MRPVEGLLVVELKRPSIELVCL